MLSAQGGNGVFLSCICLSAAWNHERWGDAARSSSKVRGRAALSWPPPLHCHRNSRPSARKAPAATPRPHTPACCALWEKMQLRMDKICKEIKTNCGDAQAGTPPLSLWVQPGCGAPKGSVLEPDLTGFLFLSTRNALQKFPRPLESLRCQFQGRGSSSRAGIFAPRHQDLLPLHASQGSVLHS